MNLMIEFCKAPFSASFEDVRCGQYGMRAASESKDTLGSEADTVFCVATGQERVRVEAAGVEYLLARGMYASIQGPCRVSGGAFWYVLVRGYRALNTFGGPLEQVGRLKYINGCTDSLLLNPVLKGDPCLNLLHFPPGIDQTFHTHPSGRIGLVISGAGLCEEESSTRVLEPGLAFHIPREVSHRFRTQDSELRVVAFHPDSDWGPEHANHPMINKTMVEGVSARLMDSLRTN